MRIWEIIVFFISLVACQWWHGNSRHLPKSFSWPPPLYQPNPAGFVPLHSLLKHKNVEKDFVYHLLCLPSCSFYHLKLPLFFPLVAGRNVFISCTSPSVYCIVCFVFFDFLWPLTLFQSGTKLPLFLQPFLTSHPQVFYLQQTPRPLDREHMNDWMRSRPRLITFITVYNVNPIIDIFISMSRWQSNNMHHLKEVRCHFCLK